MAATERRTQRWIGANTRAVAEPPEPQGIDHGQQPGQLGRCAGRERGLVHAAVLFQAVAGPLAHQLRKQLAASFVRVFPFLSERTQEIGFRIGLAVVLMLMMFATWNDLGIVKRWLSGIG